MSGENIQAPVSILNYHRRKPGNFKRLFRFCPFLSVSLQFTIPFKKPPPSLHFTTRFYAFFPSCLRLLMLSKSDRPNFTLYKTDTILIFERAQKVVSYRPACGAYTATRSSIPPSTDHAYLDIVQYTCMIFIAMRSVPASLTAKRKL
jgi:hypothetical protein